MSTALPLPSHSKHGSKDGSTQTDGAAGSNGQGEGTGVLGESPWMPQGRELGCPSHHVGLASLGWVLHKHQQFFKGIFKAPVELAGFKYL